MYALDRLDLSVVTTIDGTAEQKATQVLRGLADPAKVAKAHLLEPRLLAHGDPHRLIYSFTLCERGSGMKRVQTDNCNQPLSINEHTKLQLGSTAKTESLRIEVALQTRAFIGRSHTLTRLTPDDLIVNALKLSSAAFPFIASRTYWLLRARHCARHSRRVRENRCRRI